MHSVQTRKKDVLIWCDGETNNRTLVNNKYGQAKKTFPLFSTETTIVYKMIMRHIKGTFATGIIMTMPKKKKKKKKERKKERKQTTIKSTTTPSLKPRKPRQGHSETFVTVIVVHESIRAENI